VKDYCPIRTKEGKCGAGGECNHLYCWEKIHYGKNPELLEQKMLKWREHRRGELRLRIENIEEEN